jgi:hypothetical protein
MKIKLILVINIFLIGLFILGCSSTPTPKPISSSTQEIIQASTNTVETTSTPMQTAILQETATVTFTATADVTATSAPQVPPPSSFDIVLIFNETRECNNSGNLKYSYSFTISNSKLVMYEKESNLSYKGTFDSKTGIFSTGLNYGSTYETNDGTISYDGQTISVTGIFVNHGPDGNVLGENCFSGSTTP